MSLQQPWGPQFAGILPPLLPPVGYKPQPHTAAAVSSAAAAVSSAAQVATLDMSMGFAPNTLLSPNFVYQGGLCVAESLAASTYGAGACSAAATASACALRSSVCLDAVTRGLLSGLQPIMRAGESVLE